MPIVTWSGFPNGICMFADLGSLSDTGEGVKISYAPNTACGVEIPLVYEGAVKNDENVTLSADIRGNVPLSSCDFFFIQKSGDNVRVPMKKTSDLSETDWTHYEFTLRSPEANVRTNTAVLIFYAENSSDNIWLEIRKSSLKLERGEIATDWTPAPEEAEPTADNFSGILPIEKGGTGNSKGSILLDTNELNFYIPENFPYSNTVCINYRNGRNGSTTDSNMPSIFYFGRGTGSVGMSGATILCGNIISPSVTSTQLTLAALYEDRENLKNSVAVQSDAAMASPNFDGELSALDRNMISVYADLCLSPDSGKSVDDVPEKLRAYVSDIVEKTLAERKEAEEKYKEEMEKRKAEKADGESR